MLIAALQTYNQFKGAHRIGHGCGHLRAVLTFHAPVFLKRFGIEVKFVTDDDPTAFATAIDEKTKAIYVESIGNPKYNVAPLPELAKVWPAIVTCSKWLIYFARSLTHTTYH